MKAIVLISYTAHYGWTAIINAYNSIRSLNNTVKIIIVNNFNEPVHPSLSSDSNCTYLINLENTYELGAIKLALYSNPECDNFYIIHDSCLFKNEIPEFNDNIIFWKTSILDIAPATDIIKNWCSLYFPDIKYNDKNAYICQGLMGYFSRELLHSIFEYGLKQVKVSTKIEAVASEGMFGLLLRKFCPSISSYYQYKLADYVSNIREPSAIIKLAGGKNGIIPSRFMNIQIDTNSIAHPCYEFIFAFKNIKYNSLNACLASNIDKKDLILFEYLRQNKNALDVLTQCFPCTIKIHNDIYNINETISQNIHYLFSLKHFNVTPLIFTLMTK
jgi:hypothetical protein